MRFFKSTAQRNIHAIYNLNSKKIIEQDHEDFSKSIKSDLASFKKKALG